MKKKVIIILAVLLLAGLSVARAQSGGRCYQLNHCRGSYQVCPSAAVCAQWGGSSYQDIDGTCYANLGD